MKKIYQQPKVTVINMKTEQPLAASNQYDTTSNSIMVNGNTMDEGNGDDAAVKSYNVWDDSWE